MKLQLLMALGFGLVIANLRAENEITLKDQKDKVSYSIGVNIGTNFKQQGIDVNPEILIAGLKAALSGGKLALDQAEIQQTLTTYQRELVSKQAERSKELAGKNKEEGDTFLTTNKKKEGIKTTASGLQYKVINEGKGKKPTADDTVRVNYKGTLIDGKEFDSSYSRGEPVEFPVSGVVIPGWTEALQLMPVGSKWQLFIPSNLAYGERGQGPDIGPNATLIFEVDLLAIIDPTKAGK